MTPEAIKKHFESVKEETLDGVTVVRNGAGNDWLKPYRVIEIPWAGDTIHAVVDNRGDVYRQFLGASVAASTAQALNLTDGSIGNWNRSEISRLSRKSR